MKVTITEQGIKFRNDLIESLMFDIKKMPQRLPFATHRSSCTNFNKNLGHQLATKNLNKVKVKSPSIYLSKEFSTKYTNLQSTKNLCFSNFVNLPERVLTTTRYQPKYIRTTYKRMRNIVKTPEELNLLKLKNSKLLDLHNEHIIKTKNMYDRIKQNIKMKEETYMDDNRKLKAKFDLVNTEIKEKLTIDKTKFERKESILRRIHNKYVIYWKNKRISSLSQPKTRIEKYFL